MQTRADADLQHSMLEAELKQAEVEVEGLRSMETQVAVYQHDMRHHLTAIDGFLATNQPQRAREYIKKVQADVEAITPKRFCENELVHLLCSSFVNKANAAGIRLNKLLIEIKNPYSGQITMQDGLPVSNRDDHGYGCRSIRSITEHHQGLYSFEPQNGLFTLRVILPLKGE